MRRRPVEVSATAPAAVSVGGSVSGDVTTNYSVSYAADSMPISAATQHLDTIAEIVQLKDFAGREWLIEEIDNFLDTHDRGYVLIEASAGLGKTTFAAHLASSRSYAAHFTRLPGGENRSVALRNLAAQLLREHPRALPEDPHVRAGLVPGWAGTPSGFSHLLYTIATECACGKPLVLVVDGLDEAASPPGTGELPLGLPTLLPPGTFLVVTYRKGSRLRSPEVPSITLPIDEGDHRNVRDLHAYISSQVTKLPDTPAGFVSLLAERCAGIWVYCQFILAEIRAGLRTADGLEALPSSLTEFYLENLRRVTGPGNANDDNAWAVLATLAVAREPVTRDVLRALSGASRREIEHICDHLWRPFLTVSRGRARRYSIYHSSLREFLLGVVPWSVEGRDDLDEAIDKLRGAADTAHHRIADRYLDALGGLDDSDARIPRTTIESLDDGYPLRHLVSHLRSAGRSDELHRLLNLRTITGSGPVNLWFDMHSRTGTVEDYLSDLAIARREAERASNNQAARGVAVEALGLELRYALMSATVHDLTNNVPDSLMFRLLSTGCWDVDRALGYARGLREPERRHRALTLLLPHVEEERAATIRTESLDAAAFIRNDLARLDAVCLSLEHLGRHEIETVWNIAQSIDWDMVRVDALVEVIRRVDGAVNPEWLREALCTVDGLPPHLRGLYWAQLSEVLGRNGLDHYLDAALTDSYSRKEAVRWLAPHLDGRQLHRATRIAQCNSDPLYRIYALALLVPHLDGELQASVLRSVLADAFVVDLKSYFFEIVEAIIPYAGLDEIEGVWKLLDTAQVSPRYANPDTLDVSSSWANAVLALAGRLDEHRRSTLSAGVLTTILETSSDTAVSSSLRILAVALGHDGCRRAWERVEVIDDGPTRALALAALAQGLAPDQAAVARAEALFLTRHALSRDGYSHKLFSALSVLAPTLSAEQVDEILRDLSRIPDNRNVLQVVKSLTPVLTPAHIATLIPLLRSSPGQFFVKSVVGLLADRLDKHQIDDILAIAAKISYAPHRAEILEVLAPYLRPTHFPDALAQTRIPDDAPARPEALVRLLSYVDADGHRELAQEALQAAIAPDMHPSDRLKTLRVLAPHLDENQAGVAIKMIRGLAAHYSTASTWAALAERFDACQRGPILTEALNDVAAGPPPGWRDHLSWAMEVLAPLLDSVLLDRAIALAVTGPEEDRAAVFRVLAPYLDDPQLARALAAAEAVAVEENRAACLRALAPHLTSALMPAAVRCAESLPSAAHRIRVLCTLARTCGRPSRDEILELVATEGALAQNDGLMRAVFAELVDRTDATEVARAIEVALVLPDPDARADALIGLAEDLDDNVRGTAIEIACESDNPRTQSLLLVALAHHMTQDQARAAATVTATIDNDSYRAEAVAALLPQLDSDTRAEIVDDLLAAEHRGQDGFSTLLDAVALLTDRQIVEMLHLVVSRPREEAAAYLLSLLAPRLTPDRFIDSVSTMLDGLGHEEGDEYIRGELLETLAECGTPDQILRALQLVATIDVNTDDDMKVRHTALRRAQEADAPIDARISIVRHSLYGRSRKQYFELLDHAMPIVAELGGRTAVATVIEATLSVVDW